MKKEQKRIAAVLLILVLAIANLAIQPVHTQAATKKATSIKLNATKKTLYVGQSTTLKVKTVKPAKASKAVTWTTSNKKIATVSTKGKVTAKKAGTAKITAVSKSNKKVRAVCTITVKTKKATPTPTPTVTAPPVGGDIVHSGAYGNTTWTIDKDGLLVVKGTGDMYPLVNEEEIDKDSYYNWERLVAPAWYEYCDEIKSARIEVTGATHLNYLLYDCSKLVNIDLTKLDTSKVTSMRYMFSGCRELTSLEVRNFNTSKVTDMSFMFYGCGVSSLDLSNFDTSKVTSMDGMFIGCAKLTSLDVSNFDTSEVTSMWRMFSGCKSLISLDLSNFDTSKVTDMEMMFNSCESLASLDISNFDISKVENMSLMFFGCHRLNTIHTPKKSTKEVPELLSGTWKGSNGNTYTTLPANATESIILTRDVVSSSEENADEF